MTFDTLYLPVSGPQGARHERGTPPRPRFTGPSILVPKTNLIGASEPSEPEGLGEGV